MKIECCKILLPSSFVLKVKCGHWESLAMPTIKTWHLLFIIQPGPKRTWVQASFGSTQVGVIQPPQYNILSINFSSTHNLQKNDPKNEFRYTPDRLDQLLQQVIDKDRSGWWPGWKKSKKDNITSIIVSYVFSALIEEVYEHPTGLLQNFCKLGMVLPFC